MSPQTKPQETLDPAEEVQENPWSKDQLAQATGTDLLSSSLPDPFGGCIVHLTSAHLAGMENSPFCIGHAKTVVSSLLQL